MAVCDTVVEEISETKTYDSADQLPNKKVALVLGTSKANRNGYMNPYFTYRMHAVAELYRLGKIKYVLVSGDNGQVGYDEASDMKAYLIELGVPEDKIYMDFAGFSTLDSIVRCNEVFLESDIVIVSQEFHNERAVFLSQFKGMEAVAYNAKDVNKRYGLPVLVREKFARVKAVIDLVFHMNPKYLGPTITIGNA